MGSRKVPTGNTGLKQAAQISIEEGRPSSSPSSSKKRKCIAAACAECRKRKSRCDGEKPICSACKFVYKTPCSFNDSKSAESADIKAAEETPTKCSALADHEFVKTLLEASFHRTSDLVDRLRALGTSQAVLDELKKEEGASTTNTQIIKAESPSWSNQDHHEVSGEPMIVDLRTVRRLGYRTSPPGTGEQSGLLSEEHDGSGWTAVTKDCQLVKHLLKLYFTWSDPFYMFISKRHFDRDFLKGRNMNITKYCSPLLVNALCAYGCLFSDLPGARLNPDEPDTAGRHFMQEARRLLEEERTVARLTTVQALGVMSIYEVSTGLEQSGSLYIASCLRMAMDMNLNRDDQPYKTMDADEAEAAQITFWGCFNLDCAWSLYLGRTPAVSMSEISLDRAPGNLLKRAIPDRNIPTWRTYDDKSPDGDLTEIRQDFTLFQQVKSLSCIINAMMHSYYASGRTVGSTELLNYHKKYSTWHEQLPQHLKRRADSSPAIATLHLYYSSCVIHLFMPLMRQQIVDSPIIPRTECTQQAHAITTILSEYQGNHGLRHVLLPMPHILMSAMYVHLYNWPAENSREKLGQAMRILTTMASHTGWAARCVNFIINIAREMGKDIDHLHTRRPVQQLIPSSSKTIASNLAAPNALTTQLSHPNPQLLGNRSESVPVDAISPASIPALSANYPISNTTASHPPTPQTSSQNLQFITTSDMPHFGQNDSNQDPLYFPVLGRHAPLHNSAPTHQMSMDLSKLLNEGSWSHLGYVPLNDWNEGMVPTTMADDVGSYPNMSGNFVAPGVDIKQQFGGYQNYSTLPYQGNFQAQNTNSANSATQDHGTMPGQSIGQVQTLPAHHGPPDPYRALQSPGFQRSFTSAQNHSLLPNQPHGPPKQDGGQVVMPANGSNGNTGWGAGPYTGWHTQQ